jgi:alkanesulfonate monooxygenase SsuD/methylene tetrahydromethanopterin reductase-like flavin-dependent oxidoreductase (luciferase family)
MLDCYSNGRIISGFVRGTPVETLQAGIDPSENRERFEEAHDLIIKCWTTPGPFRYEGKYYHYRVVNPWVLPIQKPRPEVWFPGFSSPESVVWTARHQHPYMNLGSLLEHTELLKKVYIDTAREVGFTAGPEHFGYLLKILVADTDEKAQEIGRNLLWTREYRLRGPREHMDPPGYQSRSASAIQARKPAGAGPMLTYEELQELGSVVIGSPETVTRKLTNLIEQLSPGYLILIAGDGNVPHEDVMRSIELLGKEVVPALHEIKLQPYE